MQRRIPYISGQELEMNVNLLEQKNIALLTRVMIIRAEPGDHCAPFYRGKNATLLEYAAAGRPTLDVTAEPGARRCPF